MQDWKDGVLVCRGIEHKNVGLGSVGCGGANVQDMGWIVEAAGAGR